MKLPYQVLALTTCFTLISHSTGVTSAALVNAGSTTTSFPSFNTTSVGLPIVPVDRYFAVESEFSDAPIDELSCLMFGVNVMADLALKNWIDSTPAFRSDLLPKYPLAYVDVQPEPPHTDIPNRFLIWGFEMALREYIIRPEFDEAQFHLMYRNKRVGTIKFLSTLVPSRETAENSTFAHRSVNNTSSTPFLAASSEKPHIIIDYFASARVLDRDSVFLAVYATLKAVAFPRASSISTVPFQIRPGAGRNIKIGFSSNDFAGQSPELQYRWIIEALREVPDWMVENVFKEVMMYVYFENLLVGSGSVDMLVAQASTS
ncbi:MAG: hypothetical protein Q9191_005409 [Dirinaria sp. TL-2023a]